ncbi:hypothetical protein F1559_001853 [Cyanidiococcus yangmingshanensis]|uniref:Pentatricopeptide repeat-containing protein-mitochondrial domain-containing protein n=1 Tax=Cyanidiococcus yangmingshanensis TaxID=2690220 RepID=A0A7J7IQH5_9RHOD|nr:hypothetical protein F1559_001853 [Cyanidiococcus yangmingshanensis]
MRETGICTTRIACFLTSSPSSNAPNRGRTTRPAHCETRPQQGTLQGERNNEPNASEESGFVDTSNRSQRTCDSTGTVCLDPTTEFGERLVASAETDLREGPWYVDLPWPERGICSYDQGATCRKAPDIRLPRSSSQQIGNGPSTIFKQNAHFCKELTANARQSKPTSTHSVTSFLFNAQKVVDTLGSGTVSVSNRQGHDNFTGRNLTSNRQPPLQTYAEKPIFRREDSQGNTGSQEYMLATEKVAFATASGVLADEDGFSPLPLENGYSSSFGDRSPPSPTSWYSKYRTCDGKETNRKMLPSSANTDSVAQRHKADERFSILVPHLDPRDTDASARFRLISMKQQHTSVASMRVKDIRSTRQLNKILSTLYKSGRAAEALEVCKLVEADGRISMDVASYSILISCLGKCGAPAQAIEMFHKMVKEGVAPNAFTFSAIFGALSDSSYLDQAWEFLQMIRSTYPRELNVVVYNAILKFVGRAGRIDAALELLGQMERDSNVQPDIVTYGTILDICAKKQDVALAYAVLDRMRRRGIRPNNFCYASLIDACARAGLPDQAESLFRQLREEGLEYDIFVCNALLGAFARARMVERAFSAFAEMRDAGLRGDRITFNTLITAAARAREFDRAWKAFETMKNANISADTTTYNALIDACSKSGMSELAFALFEEMRGANLRPTIFTFNALIGACTRLQDMHRASHVLSLMENFGVPPDTFTLNILLTACARIDDFEYALNVVREFETRYRIVLDRLGCSILANLCMKTCETQSADFCTGTLRAAINDGCGCLREVLDRVMGSLAKES